MTTYDLDTMTFANIGEEATNESRLEYSALFLNAYNEAYITLCNSTLKPLAGQTVTLDADKRFRAEDMQKKMVPGGIVAIKPHADYRAEFEFVQAQELEFHWMEDGSVAVPAAKAANEVYVIYHCAPDTLLNATPDAPGSGSVPVLMPAEYHGALASYAASSFFRVRRKFERMQVWMEAWLSAVRDMRGCVEPSSLKINNVYTPMP